MWLFDKTTLLASVLPLPRARQGVADNPSGHRGRDLPGAIAGQHCPELQPGDRRVQHIEQSIGLRLFRTNFVTEFPGFVLP